MSGYFLPVTACVRSQKTIVYPNKQKRYDQTCRHRGKYEQQNDVTRTCLPELGNLSSR